MLCLTPKYTYLEISLLMSLLILLHFVELFPQPRHFSCNPRSKSLTRQQVYVGIGQYVLTAHLYVDYARYLLGTRHLVPCTVGTVILLLL